MSRAFALLVTVVSVAMSAQALSPTCATATLFRCPEWAIVHDAGQRALPWAQVVIGDLLIVAGQGSTPSSLIDYEVGAFDTATGDLRWSAHHGGSNYDYVWAIAPTPDEAHVAVTGTDGDTILYEVETGAEAWHRQLAPGGFLGELAFTADGAWMILTGAVIGPDGSPDLATMAVDAETGAVMWNRSEGTQTWYPEWGLGVDVTEDIAIVTGGSRLPDGSGAGVVIGYDVPTGAELWRAYLPHGLGRSVAVSADGDRAYVSGLVSYTSQPGWVSTLDWRTIAFDVVTGTELWRRDHAGPRFVAEPLDLLVGGTFNAPAARMALAEEKDLVLVGGWIEGLLTVDLYGIHDRDLALVAYDGATGTTAWSATHGLPLHDWEEGWGIGVSRDGERAYLAGLQSDAQCTFLIEGCYGTRMDAVTLAYDTTDGAVAWSWRDAVHTSLGERSAGLAVAESPDGARVFTSAWLGRPEGSDWLVVAHET